jgi:peptidoglycan/LPS O-acetylase OafA/YrhL
LVVWTLINFRYQPPMHGKISNGDSSRRSGQPTVDELDALRGIGAISVVLFHLTTRFPQMFPDADHVPVTFWAGEYRVLLFFALSGFAIFFTLDRIETVMDFAVNRFARLFPAYWATLPLVLAFVWMGDVDRLQIPAVAELANITMLQGFLYLPAIDGAYWTLTVELGFYASMLGLWLLLGRKLDRLEPMLLPWLGLKILMYVWQGMPSRIAMVLTLQFLPYFVIGMLYYRIWAGQRSWQQQAPYFAAALGVLAVTEMRDMLVVGFLLVGLFGLVLGGCVAVHCGSPAALVRGNQLSALSGARKYRLRDSAKSAGCGAGSLVGAGAGAGDHSAACHGIALWGGDACGQMDRRAVERASASAGCRGQG